MARRTDCVFHQRGRWISPATGEPISFDGLMDDMAKKSVVMLGETHDIAEIHRWQLHTAAFLYARRPNMMMGFEMFPRRIQPVLDEWVSGKLDTRTFIEKSEWQRVWGFPAELYLPLFHFCRQYGIRMLALNCYRELVTRIGREGWEAVPVEERDGLTPSAAPLPGYVRYLQAMTGGSAGGRENMPVDGGRFMRAMQTWDRAFACNIASALKEAKPEAGSGRLPLVIGIIGRGHLEYRFGTPYQLADLGIADTAVLLPSQTENWQLRPDMPGENGLPARSYADAVFRLDVPEPVPERRMPERVRQTDGQADKDGQAGKS